MTAKRRAPEGGYAFEAKDGFRGFVWNLFAERGVTIGDPVALMPSIEGKEIDVALSRGMLESSLHVIDRNPAIVATLKRRYPGIHTYGVEVERAFERMASGGVKVKAASLDLCCHSGWSAAPAILAGATGHDAFADGALLVVNTLRGRESGEHDLARAEISEESAEKFEYFKAGFKVRVHPGHALRFSPRDGLRVVALMNFLPRHCPELFRVGMYRSVNGQSFLVTAFRIWTSRALRSMASYDPARAARIAAEYGAAVYAYSLIEGADSAAVDRARKFWRDDLRYMLPYIARGKGADAIKDVLNDLRRCA